MPVRAHGTKESPIPVATQPASREAVLTRAGGGDPYAVLDAALPYLRESPRDDLVRVLAFRAFDSLGLWTPAQRLAEGGPESPDLRPALRLGGRPGADRIAWGSLESVFRANLDVLRTRTNCVDELERTWRSTRLKLELLHAADGSFQVFSRIPDWPQWVPRLCAHRHLVDAEALWQSWRRRFLRPVAVAGLGLGDVPLAVVAASHDTYLSYSPTVHLIEPSLVAWAVALHLHDWRTVLALPRVRIHAGPAALESFAQSLDDEERELPLIHTGAPPWPDTGAGLLDTLTDLIKAAAERRKARQRARRASIVDTYPAREAPGWARRFAQAGQTEPPLTILGVVSRFTTVLQYSMQDLLAAFERRGHQTSLLTERDGHGNFPEGRLLQEIADRRPDLLIVIDHLQHERGELLPTCIPAVSWIQDWLPNLFAPRAGQNVRPLEFVIGHSVGDLVVDFDYPAGRFLPCHIPCSPDALLDPNESAADRAPYECDVMYCTHAPEHASPEVAYRALRGRCDDVAGRLVDAAFELVSSTLRHNWPRAAYGLDIAFARLQEDTGVAVVTPQASSAVVTGLRQILDQYLRQDAIRAVARWADAGGRRFHLYGRGWDRFPEFAKYHRGVLTPGRELGRAYRAARVSLHAGVNSALHQRVLDGLCAGGFMLLPASVSERYPDVLEGLYRYALAQQPALPFIARPAHLAEPLAARFRQMLAEDGQGAEGGIEITSKWLIYARSAWDTGDLPTASRLWRCYADVTFRDAAELVERVEHFVTYDDQRRATAAQMRAAVVERLTYDHLAGRMLEFMQAYFARRS